MFKNLNFYFVRHGETHWNELQLFQGKSDSDLTLKGIHQAKLTAKALHYVIFNAAYSSPQKRAVDTASMIIAKRQIPLLHHDGLVEIDFGQWEQQFVPNYYQHPNFIHLISNAKKYDTTVNGGESFQTVLTRSLAAIKYIIKHQQNGNVLVVSHGSVLRQLIYVLTGGDWQDHLQHTKKLDNTSISIINYQQASIESIGQFTMLQLNGSTHLF